MKPTITLAVLLLALAGFPLHAQQVYKCPGADGKVEFQQTPCAGGKGEAVAVRQGNVVEGNPAGHANLREQLLRDAKVRSAIERRELMSGMTTAEMQQVMGRASVVNSDHTADGVRQQHVYRGADGSARYVYTQNGYVVSMQDRPGYGAPAVRPGCENAQGRLANLRFDESSVTRTQDEKREIRQRMQDIESRCR